MNQRAEGFPRKALLYRRAATIATDPDVSRAYLDLACQLQAMAKQTEAFERTANLRQGIWWPEAGWRDDDNKRARRRLCGRGTTLPDWPAGFSGLVSHAIHRIMSSRLLNRRPPPRPRLYDWGVRHRPNHRPSIRRRAVGSTGQLHLAVDCRGDHFDRGGTPRAPMI